DPVTTIRARSTRGGWPGGRRPERLSGSEGSGSLAIHRGQIRVAALAVAVCATLLVSPARADDEDSDFQLMRPIWSLGCGDAGWLFDYRGQEKHATVAVFPLAMIGAKDDKSYRETDTTARLTRAIPLYVAERLFLETTCDVPVNMLVVPG